MPFKFGNFNISESEVFYESSYSIGLVNLKPIAPGRKSLSMNMPYVLIVPKRVVPRYSQLTAQEVTDLSESAKLISNVIEDEYCNASSKGCIWLIQDGKEAGQTVPHVHLHLIPKRFAAWFQDGIESEDRVPRSWIEMKQEAEQLKIKCDNSRVFKPLSRFVEHFDLMPPTELLDTSSVELPVDEPPEQPNSTKQPLYALPPGIQRKYPSNLSIQSAAAVPSSALMYSPTSPTADIRDSSRKMTSTAATQQQQQGPFDLLKSVGRSQSHPANALASNNDSGTKETNDPPSVVTMTKAASPPPEPIVLANTVVAPLPKDNNNTTYASPTSSLGKSKLSRASLNRADIIIKRYDAWSKFLTLIIAWVSELSRLSAQSERSFSSLLKKDHRFSQLQASNIESANGIHATIHGFTMDLALQEQQFGHRLKEHVPILEKFKKECATHQKGLKSRTDLALDEFLRRAEVTASLMTQLHKACKEARRTIEKGAYLTSDPWLVNLYVLRQLKREVDEENRLRRLMVPIQQAMFDFETRLLKAAEDTIKLCLERPGSLSQEKLDSLETSLNAAVSDNWSTFVAKNKKDLVNEKNTNKHYLKINYPFKNDPLVMTLHKGELERRSGVLSKYIQRFFVLTESGFLHQFKLNDKVSPEFSIYIPNVTIIPSMDISHLNLTTLQAEPEKSSNYSFEIQRSGSVLQRDKSYVFRTSSLAEMVVWSKLLSDVATRPLDTVLLPRQLLQYTSRPPTVMSGLSSARSSMLISPRPMSTAQHQETTPPPSPVQQLSESLQSKIDRMSAVTNDIPPFAMQQPTVSPTTSTELYMPAMMADYPMMEGRHKQYSPQLNI
ncbi:fragile histidine triad protein [Mucor ambiguus]|uniref:Fragile histidine triad protein n=1 Tax=Mucor ambiguus TaxID=91626 RepID=A0A0C9LVA8_9FUNG|nr:fragile histidine triad protein [Mucor ambiguus]